MTNDRPNQLLLLARTAAASIPNFHCVQGPGKGDHATGAFMHALREQAAAHFREDCSEKKICGENSFAVDFYFPDEEAIVEVALGLSNPNSEFEKDILKALMAKENGFGVSRLCFISRPGATKTCNQPGRSAVKVWARHRHGLSIDIYELEGEPRKRRRSGTIAAAENL